MPETNLLGINEDRAAEIVRRALLDAARDLELIARRKLASGGSANDIMLDQIAAALEKVAKEYGLRITRGEWGRMIIDAARRGALVLDDSPFDITRAQINVALYNAGAKIKGLLLAGAATLNEIIASAMLTGDGLDKISKSIEQRITVQGGLIDEARADMIARNELFSIYRQMAKRAGDEAGIELYQMRGPMDSRTTAICRQHNGQVKTAAEWIKIAPLVFRYGLHYQCRHSWDPVADAQSETVLGIEALAKKQRARLAA